METVIDIFSWGLKILTLYTGLMGILFFLPRKKFATAAPSTRFAILIPARNEENVIGNLIESLQKQDYPPELFDIIAIPNNCTDDTAGAARKYGAKILPCTGTIRGKGDVLHQAFEHLMGKYDAYCVFDADNIVDPQFLARMNDAVAGGALAAKGRQMASNPYESWISGCYDIYIENFNTLYNRSRASLGLSAKLVGTGFMVTDKLMQQLGGWNAFTITEDTEFGAMCAMNNVRVHYVPEAINYDEQPTTFAISMRQRRRWSAGVQTSANIYVPKLLRCRPTWLTVDFAIFLAMIYVQLLLAVPMVYGLVGLPMTDILNTLALALVSFYGSTALLALFLTLTARRNPLKMAKSILTYPIFVASWYPLHILSLFAKPKAWTSIPHTGRSDLRMKL